tara:strand:- start:9805 stop:10797 length:993 start_codon:yes stop_codon:yes gene_type:complete
MDRHTGVTQDSFISLFRKHLEKFNPSFLKGVDSTFISMLEEQESFVAIKDALKNQDEIKRLKESASMSPLVASILYKREDLFLYMIENKLFFDDGLCYLSAIFSQQNNVIPLLYLNQYPANEMVNSVVLGYIKNDAQISERVFYAFDLLRIAYNRYILEYMDEACKEEAHNRFKSLELKKLKQPKHNWIVDNEMKTLLVSTPETISDNSKSLIRGLVEMIPVFTWAYGNGNDNWITNTRSLLNCIYNDKSKGGIAIKTRHLDEFVTLYNSMINEKKQLKQNNTIESKFGISCLEPDTYKSHPTWILDCRINALLWILACDKWLSPPAVEL